MELRAEREVRGWEIKEMNRLIHTWGVFGLRGLVAVLLGIAAILSPAHTLNVLVPLFGCYALADGLLAIWIGLRASERKDYMGAALFEGVIGIALGIGALAAPQITEMALVYLVATWAILIGALEVFTVEWADRVTHNAWPLGLFGLASLFAGAFLFSLSESGCEPSYASVRQLHARVRSDPAPSCADALFASLPGQPAS